MADMLEELKIFNGLSLTSKDGKTIVPAITSFFQSYQEKLNLVFGEMKDDFQKLLAEKDKKIEKLESEMNSMKNRVETLENHIDDNEAYERRDVVIISGENIPAVQDGEKCDEIVCNLISSHLKVKISPNEVSTAHRLGAKKRSQQADTRSIIAKFCRRDVKTDIIYSAKRARPTGLYFNESLTPKRQTIFHALRNAKKTFPNIISGCSTREGSVYVWVKPPTTNATQQANGQNTRMIINTQSKLQVFCEKTLKTQLSRILQK